MFISCQYLNNYNLTFISLPVTKNEPHGLTSNERIISLWPCTVHKHWVIWWWSVSKYHILTNMSSDPDIKNLPHTVNSIVFTNDVWPDIVLTHSPELISNSFIVLSTEPVATYLSHGETATVAIPPVWPLNFKWILKSDELKM